MAFTFKRSRSGQNVIPRFLPAEAMSALVPGEALEFSASGRLQRCDANTDKPKYFSNTKGASGTVGSGDTAAGDIIEVLDAMPLCGIWEVPFTPLINDVVVTGGSTTQVNAAHPTHSGADDLKGGLIYIKDLDSTHVITGNTDADPSAIDFSPAAIADTFVTGVTAMTVRVAAFGFGDAALKLHASSFSTKIGEAVGDVSGGNLTVYDVNMAKKTAQIIVNP